MIRQTAFLKKVSIAHSDKCWEWVGHKGTRGYGVFRVDGRQQKAHRVSYEIFIGTIPKGHYICHKCDNPGCVNPKHLFSGTQFDNMRDMIKKGRGVFHRGSKSGMAKLTEANVRQIKRALNPKKRNQSALARKYGVSYQAIYSIAHGITWNHV